VLLQFIHVGYINRTSLAVPIMLAWLLYDSYTKARLEIIINTLPNQSFTSAAVRYMQDTGEAASVHENCRCTETIKICKLRFAKSCTCGSSKEHHMPVLQDKYFGEDSLDAICTIQSAFLSWMQSLTSKISLIFIPLPSCIFLEREPSSTPTKNGQRVSR